MKAVPHPYEPLTDKGKAVIQRDIDFMHTLFTDHVVASRPNLSSANANETWATGESFFGEQALQLGLIDAPLRTLDSLLSNLIGAHNARQQSSGGLQTMPKRLVINSEAARAAISAGIPAISLGTEVETPETPDPLPAVQPIEETVLSPEAKAVVADEAEEASKPKAEATPLHELTSNDGTVTLLQTQLHELSDENKGLQEKLIRLQIEHEQQGAQVAELQQLHKPLCTAIERLEVGLGHRPSSLEGLSATALVSTYDRLYAELMKLPVGQQSMAAPTPQETDQGQTIVNQRLTSIPGGRR
jgi:hypothetical protein